MRLAVMADIHGNLDALQAVLRDMAARGVDRVLVNGDVVNRGPDSAEVLELLLTLPGLDFTLGNHDDLLRLWARRSPDLPPAWFSDPFWEGAAAWSAEQLGRAGLLDVPQAWPMSRAVEVAGLPPILAAHGTAEHYREGLSERMAPERLRAVSRGFPVLVGSHIHRPVLHQTPDVLVLGTGAVGVSADGDPRARGHRLAGERFEAHLHQQLAGRGQQRLELALAALLDGAPTGYELFSLGSGYLGGILHDALIIGCMRTSV